MPLGVPAGMSTFPVLGSMYGSVGVVGVAVCTVTLATVGVLVPILSLVRTLPPVVGVVVLVGVTVKVSPTAVIVGVATLGV